MKITAASKAIRVLIVIVAAAVLMVAPSAGAQSNGLGITPRKDYTLQAGKNVTDNLFVSNLSLTQDLLISMKVVDFQAADESGTPALEMNAKASQTPWSLKPFIKLSEATRIGAGKSVSIPFTLTIPANQGAGSYYSAIEYSAQNPETKQQVNISASSATLVFVTVPGNAKEQLTLKQFGAYDLPATKGAQGRFASVFLGGAPKEMAYRVQNSGNVAEQPSGSIVIKNIFGRTVKEVVDANPRKQLALIGQTRRIEVCVKSSVLSNKAPTGQETKQTVCDDPGLWPGRYTAEIALYYGMSGHNMKEIMATSTFWYLPLWFIISAVVLLTIIIAAVLLIMHKLSRRKRRFGHRW